MKLVEILARELNEWPDTTACFAQDCDGDIYNYVSTRIVIESGDWEGLDCSYLDYSLDSPELYGQDLASDHSTAIVTREMWDQERAKLNGIDWSKAPAGATHCNVQGDCVYKWLKDSPLSFYNSDSKEWVEYLERVDGETHLSWSVAKPIEDDGWNGEGLPPVGTVCEFLYLDDEWRECEIIAHKDGLAVVWVNSSYIFSARSGILRKIKTHEQLATEERDAAIKDMKNIAMGSSINHGMLEALYDAGYRKTGESK